ncbi:MAG TPA: NADP-dependent oxidoreductase [Pyrinomonadaceae bacterium]|jgi:NADPH:quinone reductase-like Zn-dependent oxidoreductase|nr:NADP-dependent oxidoreductase [Pyrinomonadaceae bacterium]
MTQTKKAKEQTMQAVALDRFGGPETLKVQTVPVPEVGADEILIHVESAGVGAWDPFEREGGFVEVLGIKPKFPYVLGTDGAGTVAAVGEKVKELKEGDRVYAAALGNPKGGFYAEYAVVKADNASPIPGTLKTEQAAVLPSDGLTALTGLEKVLNLQPDESVMIFGASGGIGHLAVQLAKRLGARVFAVASGEDGVNFVKRLGADAVVDGRSDKVLDVAREFAPDGIDAALVTAGGDGTDRALSAIRADGRVAYPNGVMPEPKAPARVSVQAYDGEGGRELIDRLNQLIEAGPFDVHVHRIYPLEQAAQAQAALEEHHLGKIALRVS